MQGRILVHALPASCGDCLWIEFGQAPHMKRMLIDGGKVSAYEHLRSKVASLPPFDCRIHLLMVTHVDADHIEGIIALLTDATLRLEIGEIWFNGWDQVRSVRTTLGALQGELLSALLARSWASRWNYSWRRPDPGSDPTGAIVRSMDLTPRSQVVQGMTLTVLSPDRPRLSALAQAWQSVADRGHWRPGDHDRALELLRTRHRRLAMGPVLGDTGEIWQDLLKQEFAEDEAVNNGSSQAFLAEYGNHRCLLLGDAFPSVVAAGLEPLMPDAGRLAIGLTKVSHHGSRHNTDDDLLDLIDCRHFLFSTDGSTFGHPDEECIARIVEHYGPGVHLYFNHDHRKRHAWWDRAELQQKYDFAVHYPKADASGICVEVAARPD